MRRLWPYLLLLLLLGACAREGQDTTPEGGEGHEAAITPAGATPTTLILPTLLPTQTIAAAATETLANPARPTPTAQSTVDFEQPVVELRYQIAALQMDRRLEGNVSGQITVVDETRGVAAIRQNQGGVLLELQEILPTLELQPLPEDCDACVAFSYSMPLVEAQGEGWLQDPVLLASVENYTTALLGPHFPPATIVGLRRSATPYDVAHSLALDADGVLYRWLATAAEVDDPRAVQSVAPELPGLLAEVDGESLATQYIVDCPSAPFEILLLNGDTATEAAGEDGQTIRVACPAFSLPRSLLPLYVQLDALLQETLEGNGLPRPPTEVALDTVLDYRREDGAHLAVAMDGVARITDKAGETVTTTLSSSQVLSMTTALLDSGTLQPGLEAFAAAEQTNLLLVRGDQGMLEAAWPPGAAPQGIVEQVAVLDGLMALEE